MNITDQFPMIYVVVSDLVALVERYDSYKGRVWYRPNTWKKPELPKYRICTEVEAGLREYGQPWLGCMSSLMRVFRVLGYDDIAFPLDDSHILRYNGELWRGELGDRRRKLLRELHEYLREMEFGPLPPSNDQVGKILA